MPTIARPRAERTIAELSLLAASERPSRDRFEGARWTVLSLGTDTLGLWIAALLALRLQQGPTGIGAAALLGLLGVGTIVRTAALGLYGERPARMPLLDLVRVSAGATTFAAIGALATSSLIGLGASVSQLLVRGWALGTASVIASRLLLAFARRRARRDGRSGKRALIVGAGFIGAQLERRLLAAPELGLSPIGFLDGDPPPTDVAGERHGPVLGGPERLGEIVAATGTEHVIVAFSSAPDSTLHPLLRRCEEMGVEVSVVPRLFENVNEHQWVEHVGGLPLCGLRRVDPESRQFAVKHVFDRTVAALLVALASPVLIGCALAVRLSSSGPIMFRQRRIGRDGRAFDILKFRSMRIDAPAERRFTPASDSAPGGVEGDDRRTRVGTFLRRTSLDELPQLLNVLRGDMSLVGPRPERPEFVELFGDEVRRYSDRHRVKSGMTGWAQVHGLRGQTSLAERVEWDNWYIQNWSPWLDLKILLMTPMAVLHAPEEGPPPAPRQVHELDLSLLAADRAAA